MLDDAGWRRAPALTDFTLTGGNTRADPGTEVRVLYDDRHLYVGVRCIEPSPGKVKPHTKKTGWKIQHGDYLQLMLDHTGQCERVGYACTTIYGQASMFEFGWKWMRGLEVKVHTGADHWSAEFKLPLAEVEDEYRPAPGRSWGFNVIRRRVVEGGGSDWSYWSPLASSGDKFKADYCGTLTFE